MTKTIEKFKEFIESVAEHNYDDYDAVEYLDGWSCQEYNNAVQKINNYVDHCNTEVYKELFSDEEMLKVSVMYACIVTGAIESPMTQKLRTSWEKFVNELEDMSYMYNGK